MWEINFRLAESIISLFVTMFQVKGNFPFIFIIRQEILLVFVYFYVVLDGEVKEIVSILGCRIFPEKTHVQNRGSSPPLMFPDVKSY